MSKTSYHILVNIDDLYRKLLQAYDDQFTDYSKGNYEWFLKKGRNLKKYLISKGLWIDEENQQHNAEIFIMNLEREIPEMSKDKLIKLKEISKFTLQPLQTGDLIPFENIPIVRGYPWPSAAVEVLRMGVGKKPKIKRGKPVRKKSKKKESYKKSKKT
jgi:hypothetical protein